MSQKLLLLASAICILSLSACEQAKDAQTQQNNSTEATTALPANHPAIPQTPPAASLGNLQGGMIKEVIVGGGYTYVKVESNGVELWAAGPETPVQVGQLIGWHQGTVMRNFNSKSLDKTFDEILFVSGYVDPAKVNSHPQTQAAPKHNAQSAATGTGGVIQEILVGGGYTYAKVLSNGKEVWAAGPMVKLEVGEYISWNDGAKMTNFTSKTLDKTFGEIYFIGNFNKGAATAQAAPQNQSTGIVTDVITSAGYSYIQVSAGNTTHWLAAPESKVKQQDKVSWNQGSVMHNFQSRSLDRTFDEIIFVDGITIN